MLLPMGAGCGLGIVTAQRANDIMMKRWQQYNQPFCKHQSRISRWARSLQTLLFFSFQILIHFQAAGCRRTPASKNGRSLAFSTISQPLQHSFSVLVGIPLRYLCDVINRQFCSTDWICIWRVFLFKHLCSPRWLPRSLTKCPKTEVELS